VLQKELATQEQAGLHRLLEYEVRSSARYRRFISIVDVACDAGGAGFRSLLADVLRESDEVADQDFGTTILMGETDEAGALAAIRRYKNQYNGSIDIRFGVASFPRDGRSAATLLAVARRRLDRAQASGQPGAAVWQDRP
jgi:hypothetical protein